MMKKSEKFGRKRFLDTHQGTWLSLRDFRNYLAGSWYLEEKDAPKRKINRPGFYWDVSLLLIGLRSLRSLDFLSGSHQIPS